MNGQFAVMVLSVMWGMFGYFVHYMLTRVRDTRAGRTKKTPQCACGHMYGAHASGGFKCQAKVYYTGSGWSRCSCELYVGPDPMALGLWSPTKREDG